MTHRFLVALSFALACALAPLPAAAQGKTLRFASAFDPQTHGPACAGAAVPDAGGDAGL